VSITGGSVDPRDASPSSSAPMLPEGVAQVNWRRPVYGVSAAACEEVAAMQ